MLENETPNLYLCICGSCEFLNATTRLSNNSATLLTKQARGYASYYILISLHIFCLFYIRSWTVSYFQIPLSPLLQSRWHWHNHTLGIKVFSQLVVNFIILYKRGQHNFYGWQILITVNLNFDFNFEQYKSKWILLTYSENIDFVNHTL